MTGRGMANPSLAVGALFVGVALLAAGARADADSTRVGRVYGCKSLVQQQPAAATDGVAYLVVWADCRSGKYDIYGTRVTPNGGVLDPKGIAISSAPSYQQSAGVAFNGTNYLVVWRDPRGASPFPDIFGARVTPSGEVLDPSGIAISSSTNEIFAPAVASDGADFLVAWEDRRDGIYASRVSASGTVLDPAGIPISSGTAARKQPTVAFSGSTYLVAWQDSRSFRTSGDDIYGARVSRTGVVLDPEGIAISTDPRVNEIQPALASSGSQYLATWQSGFHPNFGGGDIYGARLNNSGTVLDANGIPISVGPPQAQQAAVASDGTNYLVSWSDTRGAKIYGARVLSDGSVLDPSGLPISRSGAEYSSIASVDADYLVAWQDWHSKTWEDPVRGGRVSSSGALRDPGGFPLSTVERLCRVRRVTGRPLARARRELRRGRCVAGRITRVRSRRVRRGRVVSQRPRPGAVLVHRGQVDLVLSGGRR